MNDSLAEELEALAERDPDAASLAEMASLAVEVEPALLRKLRRRFLPAASPLAETLVWSSPLVSARTSSSLVFRADACAALRARLRRRQELLDGVREIVMEAHGGVAEVIRCEEELVYLGLLDLDERPRRGWTRGRVEQRIEERVRGVLAALSMHPDRRPSLLAWSSRALPSLPAGVQDHDATRALMAVTYLVPGSEQEMTVQIHWRRAGLVLRLDDGVLSGAAVLRVPASSTVILAVEAGRVAERVALSPGAEIRVPIPADEDVAHIRSLLGGALILHRQRGAREAADTAPRWRDIRVLVAGPAQYELPPSQVQAAEALGAALAEHGCGLVTGAYQGVDHVVARAFVRRLPLAAGTDAEGVEKERLLQVVRRGRAPDFLRGDIREVESVEDEYWEPVERAAAVVIIGKAPGVDAVVRTARRAGRPVIAYPGTGAETIPGANDHAGEGSGIDEATRIVRAVLRIGSELSPVARWAGKPAMALAIRYLRPQPLQVSDSAAGNLKGMLLRRWRDVEGPFPDSGFRSDRPPERVIAYLAVQGRPSAQWLSPITSALVAEVPFAADLNETRPLWQGLVALRALLQLREIPDEARTSAVSVLRGVLGSMESASHFDEGGECKRLAGKILSEYGSPQETALVSLERIAAKYDDLRQTLRSGAERTGKMDVLVIEAQQEAVNVAIEGDAISRMFETGRPGARVVALACCIGRTSQAPAGIIEEVMRSPRTSFEQWTAVLAIDAIIDREKASIAETFAAAALAALDDPENLINHRSDTTRRHRALGALLRLASKTGFREPDPTALLRLWISARSLAAGGRRPCVAVFGSSESTAYTSLCTAVGERLAVAGWRTVIGRGPNVGPAVVAGCRRRDGTDLTVYTTTRAELSEDPTTMRLLATREDVRREMIAQADCCLVIRGRAGTEKECEQALEAGLPVLPVTFTGGTALRMTERLRHTITSLGIPEAFPALLDAGAPADEAAERIVRILNTIVAHRGGAVG